MISPTSADGENINEILRAQKEQMKENWLHKIQYHNRFNDGYIEIAEAMLDPIGDPKFVISGQKFDTNPNSNLEYYLRERGYDINDPSSIPNHVFNPVKYADARNALEQSGHYTGIDLSQVNDYYKPLSDEQIQEFLIEDIGKQTATMQHNIFEKIEIPGTIPRVWVTPKFRLLTFSEKKAFIHLVYSYYYTENSDYDAVRIFDSMTGKEIGGYMPPYELNLK